MIPPGSAMPSRRDSDVDAVAVNIFAFDDDIAKVNADAKLDTAILRHIDISFSNFLLNFYGTRNRADHAREFGQDAVAGKFDDASLMLRNVLVDYFGSNLIERGECAGLVDAHEPAVSDDIGSEDSSQTPFHVRLKNHDEHSIRQRQRSLSTEAAQFNNSTESPLRIIPSLSTAP